MDLASYSASLRVFPENTYNIIHLIRNIRMIQLGFVECSLRSIDIMNIDDNV